MVGMPAMQEQLLAWGEWMIATPAMQEQLAAWAPTIMPTMNAGAVVRVAND
jgi:hypothetical protein